MMNHSSGIVASSLVSFTNAAAAAIGEADPKELRRLASVCRDYLRMHPHDPFFTVFETLFEKSANLVASRNIRVYLKEEPRAARILYAIRKFPRYKQWRINKEARVGSGSFDRVIKRLISMGCVLPSIGEHSTEISYTVTDLGKESLSLFHADL